MDAHLFRRFCDDLIPALTGVRIEKIHQLTSGVTIFSLYGLGKIQHDTSLFANKKQSLILKSGRKPLIFLSDFRPTVGTHPPAFIMRLRKYCAGKRILSAHSHWLERKIYLEIYGGAWLCLNLKKGVELFFDTPSITVSTIENTQQYLSSSSPNPIKSNEKEILKEVSQNSIEETLKETNNTFYPSSIDIPTPVWPDFELVYAICTQKKEHLNCSQQEPILQDTVVDLAYDEQIHTTNTDIWRQYPVLTPLLRATLPLLDKEEGAALYADLFNGGGDVAIYSMDAQIVEVSPWLLPPLLLEKMSKNAKFKNIEGTSSKECKELLFEDAVSALKYAGAFTLTRLSQEIKNTLVKPLLNEAKRLDKLSIKLDKEEERLHAMLEKKEDALLLQAHLYNLDTKAKQKTIYLAYSKAKGQIRNINLDPSKTIAENMEHFFHVAGRGKRGLAHLVIRREALFLQKKEALKNAVEKSALQKGYEKKEIHNSPKQKEKNTLNSKISYNRGTQYNQKHNEIFFKTSKQNTLETQTKNKQKFPPQVQAFRSSDGFLILRGRDTKGNGLVLKMANPHDYWVHIAQGASAHVIIRRDHPEQEVPQSTLEQAGALALIKSWQKDQDKGLVQYSLAKYIRPMKAGKGLVHVDRSEGTFLAHIQKNLSPL